MEFSNTKNFIEKDLGMGKFALQQQYSKIIIFNEALLTANSARKCITNKFFL